MCGNEECQNLQDHTWPKELLDLRWSWKAMQEQECEHCKRERQRRCQLLGDLTLEENKE